MLGPAYCSFRSWPVLAVPAVPCAWSPGVPSPPMTGAQHSMVNPTKCLQVCASRQTTVPLTWEGKERKGKGRGTHHSCPLSPIFLLISLFSSLSKTSFHSSNRAFQLSLSLLSSLLSLPDILIHIFLTLVLFWRTCHTYYPSLPESSPSCLFSWNLLSARLLIDRHSKTFVILRLRQSTSP